ncbi:hypothetical protein OsI_36994 [Oryza sativa Indica Group]|uniref:Uncharacterized protein n=2 Tax=Oryza TaxID=4527 RepID=A0A0E0RBY6_ORYRU|nr:hypothetical protein OsI_36994 [Oryza sativa Indica Group]BBF89980.1 hypothetical protein [Oryza rufipogon]
MAPNTARLLPLHGPSSANTKFIAIISDSASLPAATTYIPCARPTSLEEVRLGPSVSGLSITTTVPNHVAEAFVVGVSATCTTVELGAPPQTRRRRRQPLLSSVLVTWF